MTIILRTMSISSEMAAVLGVDPGQTKMTVRDLRGIIHHGDWNVIQKPFEGVPGTLPFNQIVRVILRDGSEKYVIMKGESQIDMSGNITNIFGTARAIVERKPTAEAVKI